jgi:CRISPR/Cas system-associated endonuclease Cas1
MSVVYLTTSGTQVRRKGEKLEVWQGESKVSDLRLFELERLVVVGAVQFSSQALSLLLDRGIDVSFLTSGGRLRGSLVSAESRNVFLRLAQFDRFKDAAFRLAFGQQVVAAKLAVRAISLSDGNLITVSDGRACSRCSSGTPAIQSPLNTSRRLEVPAPIKERFDHGPSVSFSRR